jgi:hypothetical protein
LVVILTPLPPGLFRSRAETVSSQKTGIAGPASSLGIENEAIFGDKNSKSKVLKPLVGVLE